MLQVAILRAARQLLAFEQPLYWVVPLEEPFKPACVLVRVCMCVWARARGHVRVCMACMHTCTYACMRVHTSTYGCMCMWRKAAALRRRIQSSECAGGTYRDMLERHTTAHLPYLHTAHAYAYKDTYTHKQTCNKAKAKSSAGESRQRAARDDQAPNRARLNPISEALNPPTLYQKP